MKEILNTEKTLLLREYFINKIQKDWDEKWKNKYGKVFNFNELPSQNAFIDDLLFDIEKNLKSKIGLDATANIIVSKDNIRRILGVKNPSAWHEKTRNMLSYYVGFDGWVDFENKTKEEVERKIKVKSNFFVKNKLLVFSLMALLLVFLFFLLKDKFKKEYNVSMYANEINYGLDFPLYVQLIVNLDNDNYKNYKIQIDHETLQYIKQPIEIPLRKQIDKITLTFATPSHKIVKLLKNNKVVKVLTIYVPTNSSGWFGCMRVKNIETPKPFAQPEGSTWYGRRMINNTEGNYLTNYMFWKANQDKKSGALNFKKEVIPAINTVFTRVAFVKSSRFNTEIKNMTLSFKAKRDKAITEDCLSFMIHLFDNSQQGIEFYSTAKCTVNQNISMGDYAIDVDAVHKVNESYNCEPLNNVLEDNNWHQFHITFEGKFIKLMIDNKAFKIKINYSNFTKLREIWFVFDGNGSVDDVMVTNNKTKKIEFVDKFE